ncbi:Hypothetical protein NTJ_12023 [Nesidiocoris tenuis]|uniref:Uncharacterized protein n=1 Tax=Nesidiocoris tenuis TaxID=355587 RepID=A0ABN7B456_9HEMI|nr:Hypothetical protein NTJ_12023 [Nesidiocoris tenuis]
MSHQHEKRIFPGAETGPFLEDKRLKTNIQKRPLGQEMGAFFKTNAQNEASNQAKSEQRIARNAKHDQVKTAFVQ